MKFLEKLNNLLSPRKMISFNLTLFVLNIFLATFCIVLGIKSVIGIFLSSALFFFIAAGANWFICYQYDKHKQ